MDFILCHAAFNVSFIQEYQKTCPRQSLNRKLVKQTNKTKISKAELEQFAAYLFEKKAGKFIPAIIDSQTICCINNPD